jgi:DNA-binding SARP family transcriptional activator
MGGLHVGVLGRPSIHVDGAPVHVRGRGLALVVRLAVARGTPVLKSRLIDELWPNGAGTDGAFRVLLARARQHLGADAIERIGQGYTLRQATCDADEFEQLAALATHAHRPVDERIDAASRALALWSGHALDGLGSYPWAANLATRLEHQRERVVDQRFDALLEDDRLDEALPELRASLQAEPTNEHRCATLAVHLYRRGQQAEALGVLRTTRHALRDSLGLQPGPDLRRLEGQILNHDPALRAGRAAVPVATAAEDDDGVDPRLRTVATLVRAGAYDDALALLDQVEVLDAGVDPRRATTVLLTRARIAMMTGDPGADALIDEVQRIGRLTSDGHLLAAAAMVRFGRGIPDDKHAAMIEMLEPIELLPPDASEQIELLCAAAVIVTFIDASESAERFLEEAERLTTRADTPRAGAAIRMARSIVGTVRRGPVAAAIESADEAMAIAVATEDPATLVMAIQAQLRLRYALGDLRGVGELIELLERTSRAAMLPFGIVRSRLCVATNELAAGRLDEAESAIRAAETVGAQLLTHAARTAHTVQWIMLLNERDQLHEVLPIITAKVAERPEPSAWNVVAVAAGDHAAAASLLDVAHTIPRDDVFLTFVALAAEASRDHELPELARWCVEELRSIGDRTIVMGLGTAVFGFGQFFLGVAHGAAGDLADAEVALRRAVELSAASGADLWTAHAEVNLAGTLARIGTAHAIEEARQLVHLVENRRVTKAAARVRRHLAAVDGLLATPTAPRAG